MAFETCQTCKHYLAGSKLDDKFCTYHQKTTTEQDTCARWEGEEGIMEKDNWYYLSVSTDEVENPEQKAELLKKAGMHYVGNNDFAFVTKEKLEWLRMRATVYPLNFPAIIEGDNGSDEYAAYLMGYISDPRG